MNRGATQKCGVCGKAIDPAQARYSEEGDLICNGCAMRSDVQVSDAKVLSGVRGAAYGAPLAAIGSIFINPFFLLSIWAIGGGFSSALYLVRNPDMRRMAGGDATAMIVCGFLGGILGSLLLLLAFVGVFALRRR